MKQPGTLRGIAGTSLKAKTSLNSMYRNYCVSQFTVISARYLNGALPQLGGYNHVFGLWPSLGGEGYCTNIHPW